MSSKDEEEVELLPPHHPNHDTTANNGETFIGTIDAVGSADDEAFTNSVPNKSSPWTRHHCISYTITALICVFSAYYWHNRAESYDDNTDHPNGTGVSDGDASIGRVPMPPALSDLDPAGDLGFRSTTRKGLASPSKAWGEHYLSKTEFTPLPTNEWYLNLLSHKAAADPAKAGEVAHVYTVPYVVGVSPPKAFDFHSQANSLTMAGIELFVPAMKTSSINMQMIYQAMGGVSLGAVVDEKSIDKKEDSAPTSYTVDPDVPLSPLGVSLKWNHVNMKSSIVRGMPFSTVRFGQGKMKKSILPKITSGSRLVSILLDGDSSDETNSKKMKCGTLDGKPVVQDPNKKAPITSDGKAEVFHVKREIVFHLAQSDFTWVAFFSKPVKVRCYSDAMPFLSVSGARPDIQFQLDVVEVDEGEVEDELVVQMALLNECTTGKGIIKQHCEHLKNLDYETISSENKMSEYLKVLRRGAMMYPTSPLVGTHFPEEEGSESSDDEGRVTNVVFDWDATNAKSRGSTMKGKGVTAVTASSLRAASSSPFIQKEEQDDHSLLMFALPHHLETLALNEDNVSADSGEYEEDPMCLHTFHGRTCLVHGSVWNLSISHGKPHSFLADRPPVAGAIPSIAEALNDDIKFKLSENVLRGAADTYFPAKILAKMSRVIEINEELQNLKSGEPESNNYSDAEDASVEEAASAAAEITLPSEEDVESLLDDLQQSVEIWLNPGGKEKGGGEAEFLYDASWGGFVNCGCKYTFEKKHPGEGSCSNTFPDCPAIKDVNEDFGNGWYNDHHFHYGYHIYAAAVVAKHRPDWGRKYFDRILLYIRDIANPSADDKHFPMYRQKDWYLGNSWAAGLMSMELSPHGREQESSSEAIAAFEGIALYGNVMMDVFGEDEGKLGSARLVRNVGELLTAMEVSAANRFWHVWGSKTDEEGSTIVSTTKGDALKSIPHINTYPKKYPQPVVGMMYDTMASFQTWFAPEDVVSYGIQLIPLTAVAERRDDPEWSNILYPLYAKSCEDANEANDGFCNENGWSIVQAALLSETGEVADAFEMAQEIPEEVFISDGACGNSLSNTLWFISTRKQS